MKMDNNVIQLNVLNYIDITIIFLNDQIFMRQLTTFYMWFFYLKGEKYEKQIIIKFTYNDYFNCFFM